MPIEFLNLLAMISFGIQAKIHLNTKAEVSEFYVWHVKNTQQKLQTVLSFFVRLCENKTNKHHIENFLWA